jgi:extradiol dioxygenase family protein
VQAWHNQLEEAGVESLTEPTLREDIGVHCFFLEDPAGYKIEVQKFIDK